VQLGASRPVLTLVGVCLVALMVGEADGYDPRPREVACMADPKLELVASLRDGPRLLVEQGAIFDLVLKNAGTAAADPLALEGNEGTPALIVYQGGKRVWQRAPRTDLEATLGVHAGEPPPGANEAQTVHLEPGETTTALFRLWDYDPPLPPGKYEFEAVHAGKVTSNRVPFEIVATRVHCLAVGYDGYPRKGSLLAWVGSGPGVEPRLLVRLSGRAHGVLADGATSLGPVPPDSQLAVATSAPGKIPDVRSWVAACSGREVLLHRHHSTFPAGRLGPLALGVKDARPLPRFPVRGAQAVFLATGRTEAGLPALVGLVVAGEGAEAVRLVAGPWVVPLAAAVTHAACAFEAAGTIALLFASEAGTTTTLSRLDVDERGGVVAPERIVGQLGDLVLGLAGDVRHGAPPGFAVLIGERGRAGAAACLKLALDTVMADVTFPIPTAVTGWPDGESAAVVAFDLDLEGRPWLLVQEGPGGASRSGPLEGGLRPAAAAGDFPHLVLPRGAPGSASFGADGRLQHPRAGAGHSH
jgi:hypothetical protein